MTKAQGDTVQKTMPMGKIGGMEISRLILGGNLLGLYTHCRDQNYVYGLIAHYNTPEKILETLAKAEANGINSVNIYSFETAVKLMARYRREGGKMKWIHCQGTSVEDPALKEYGDEIKKMCDLGADAFYVWGEHADVLVSQNKLSVIARCLDIYRQQGKPGGVGAHALEVVQACEKAEIGADFYVKTFHHHDYASAPAEPQKIQGAYCEIPGCWCKNPEETADFMKSVKKPWIAFKTMAAGVISPESAFEHAFRNGADYIFAGMFDYEIENDAEIARSVIAKIGNDRPRPWR